MHKKGNIEYRRKKMKLLNFKAIKARNTIYEKYKVAKIDNITVNDLFK